MNREEATRGTVFAAAPISFAVANPLLVGVNGAAKIRFREEPFRWR